MANRVDPDQMLHSAASDLGLHCLQMPNCPTTYGYYGTWVTLLSSIHFPISLLKVLIFINSSFIRIHNVYDFQDSNEEELVPCIKNKSIRQTVQTMARFMAAYFSNEPMFIFPPHSAQALPSVHMSSQPTSKFLSYILHRTG